MRFEFCVVVCGLLVLLCEASKFDGASLGDCDPIDPTRCLLPFPNNFWLRLNEDGQMRLFISNNSVPKDIFGKGLNPEEWNEYQDGFSPFSPIISFWEDLSLLNLPRHENIARSLDSDSASVLIDATTYERVPHWAELDFSQNHTEERILIIWPASRLSSSRRYIVALRNLAPRSTGIPYQPSKAFLALRDNITSNDPNVNLRRPLFEDIFTRLRKAGVSRNNIQLAWDFTVGSRQSLTGRLIHMRDDMFSRIPQDGPNYSITNIIDNPSKQTLRKIQGKVQVPLYLTNKFPGAHLVLDETGLPVFQTFAEATFTLQIPQSASNYKSGSLPVLQYGHGLFGTQDEVSDSYLQAFANTNGYITIACDWWGLAQEDEAVIVAMVAADLSDFRIIPDRCQQGVLNQLVLTKLVMSTRFANDKSLCFNFGCPLDPTQHFFWGNSLGSILGGVFLSVSTDILQGALGVLGTPFSLLLPRSEKFSLALKGIEIKYPNALDRAILLEMMQLLWDRGEPAGYVDSLISNPLPNTPPKFVLMQYGLSDAQVSWLAGLGYARSANAKMFPNNVRAYDEVLFGFEVANGDVTEGAVVVGFNFSMPIAPQTNIPPDSKYDTHEKTRQDPRAQKQIDILFKKKLITDTCGGNGCNP